MRRMIGGGVALAVALAACVGGSATTAEAPDTTPRPSSSPSPDEPVVLTRADSVRKSLDAYGFTEITSAPDDVIADAADKLCSSAESALAFTGESGVDFETIQSLGRGFVRGLRRSTGIEYSAEDGAIIVETFLIVYCPDVF